MEDWKYSNFFQMDGIKLWGKESSKWISGTIIEKRNFKTSCIILSSYLSSEVNIFEFQARIATLVKAQLLLIHNFLFLIIIWAFFVLYNFWFKSFTDYLIKKNLSKYEKARFPLVCFLIDHQLNHHLHQFYLNLKGNTRGKHSFN